MDGEQAKLIAESIFRWLHVIAGITWIGLLYFFNWVNSAVAPTMDGETKKKVLPELLPRTLYWFRWGAAYTWFFGVLLLGLLYYMQGNMMQGQADMDAGAWAVVGITFFSVIVYDILYKTVLTNPVAGFWGGWILASGVVLLFQNISSLSFRGYTIHLGAMFGTFMAFNVWMRIWPAQRKIIAAIQAGEPPPKELAALAGLRSKHNTYMSVPLVFAMLAQHGTWAEPAQRAGGFQYSLMPAIILVGWGLVYMCYKKASSAAPKQF